MQDIKKALDEQIKQLEYELTTELPAEIKKAVALGDLSENAEYHMAKQRQEFCKRSSGSAQKAHGRAFAGQHGQHPARQGRLRFHRSVVMDTAKDQQLTYKLVTSEESDVANGLISTTSPIGPLADRQRSRRHRHRCHAYR